METYTRPRNPLYDYKVPSTYIPQEGPQLDATAKEWFKDVQPGAYHTDTFQQLLRQVADIDYMTAYSHVSYDAEQTPHVLTIFATKEEEQGAKGYIDCIAAGVQGLTDPEDHELSEQLAAIGRSFVRRVIGHAIDADHQHTRVAQITAERVQKEENAYKAAYDNKLGILNDLGWNRHLDFVFTEQKKLGVSRELKKGLVDLTNFKKVNDKLGHNVGDAVLLEAMDELRETTRQTDDIIFVREGGDEIGMLFAGMSHLNIEEFSSRLFRQQLAKLDNNGFNRAFDFILNIQAEAQAAGNEGLISITDKVIREGRMITPRMVCVDDEPLLPVRQFSILAFGWATGEAASTREFKETVCAAADIDMTHAKSKLHRLMGGAHRPN